jgi:hypothetical protein
MVTVHTVFGAAHALTKINIAPAIAARPSQDDPRSSMRSVWHGGATPRNRV